MIKTEVNEGVCSRLVSENNSCVSIVSIVSLASEEMISSLGRVASNDFSVS